ncbi:MAG: bacterioferritin [Deltaproteobacteria bacterium RBG_13_65_10]|nr:MAG: bacterioferritin [Deltaproteobacteria bacterium RBG_13_65_10]
MAVTKRSQNTQKTLETLNAILELELAGVVRYTHYSLMVFGHARIPIVKWMRDQASEGMAHAVQAGEYITALGGHPSLKIGKLLETERHDIDQILREALEHEQEAVDQYYRLLRLVRDKNVMLEEYARAMIQEEETHLAEIEKMLRRSGKLDPVR